MASVWGVGRGKGTELQKQASQVTAASSVLEAAPRRS